MIPSSSLCILGKDSEGLSKPFFGPYWLLAIQSWILIKLLISTLVWIDYLKSSLNRYGNSTLPSSAIYGIRPWSSQSQIAK